MAERRLTPEQIAAIQAQIGSSGWGNTPYYIDPTTGRAIQQINRGSGGSAESGNDAFQLGGYSEYAPREDGNYAGQTQSIYGADGKYDGDYAMNDNSMKEAMMMFLASVGGMQFLPGGLMNPSAAAGAAGAGGTGTMPMLAGPELGAYGAELGTSLSPFAAGGGAAAAAGGAGAAGAAGAGGTAATAAGGGLLSSLPGWVPGAAATIAGAALGAKGNEQSATSERKMDPRLDPYVFGEKGVVPMAHGLLQQQMPIAQQYGQQMGQVGQGLLNMPAAGNGFGLFTRGRY